jgi:hypothetical protein
MKKYDVVLMTYQGEGKKGLQRCKGNSGGIVVMTFCLLVHMVEQTAHAVSDKKSFMSLAFTISDVLSSDLHNMFPRTA